MITTMSSKLLISKVGFQPASFGTIIISHESSVHAIYGMNYSIDALERVRVIFGLGREKKNRGKDSQSWSREAKRRPD